MWGRVVEIVLGLWLVISPFIFRHYPESRALWLNDIACGGAVVLIACGSFWRPIRRVHLLNLAIGAWLILFGYFYSGYPAPPGAQNEMFVGLTLLLIAIIPNEATLPTESWRAFYRQRAEETDA